MTSLRFALMAPFLLLLSACVSYQAGPPIQILDGSRTGQIYFQSTDNYGFNRGDDPIPITVDGILEVPPHHNGDVVITSHGSGGVRNHQVRWERFLQAQGYATFSLNHFGPRDVPSTVLAQVRVTEQQMAADIVYAARLLDSDRRFGAGKKFHLGWSKGAIAGLEAAIEYREWLDSEGGLLIDGFIEFYPYCGFTGDLSSAARILILHGKRDDWTLYEPCERVVAALVEAGSDARIEGFEDAYHGFDSWTSQIYRLPRALAVRNTSPECTLRYSRDKPLISEAGGYTIGDFDSRLEFLKRCASRGVTAGGSAKYRERVQRMLLEFLRAP